MRTQFRGNSNDTNAVPSIDLLPRSFTLAATLLAASSVWAQPIVADRFDAGAAGWGFYNDGTNLRWSETGGNPGGCLIVDDDGAGTYWGFSASSRYLGNRSCLYNGVITADVNPNLSSTSGGSNPDIALIGGGITLAIDLPVPPANVWTTRRATLHETAGWRKTNLSGAVPTQAEFLTVLSNLTAIRIRGEFSGSVDSARLDNVAIASFLLDSLPSLQTCRGSIAELSVDILAGSANGPFTYQWRKDGTPIDPSENPTAQTDSLALASVQDDDQGVYDCIVTNTCGSQFSPTTTLSVCSCLSCAADFNEDGGVDGEDVNIFFIAWESGDCDADVNVDGGVDGDDISVFFAQWEAGGC